MQNIIEVSILKKKISDISFNYRNIIRRHRNMIEITTTDYKNGGIDLDIYENDINYHKKQIKIVRGRIRELKKAYNLIEKARKFIESKKYNSFVYEVGDKVNS